MEHLEIEYISLDKLKPYENNARLHTETDLATIENSIKEFGMCDPIGIWSDKNVIVEGHGRLLALKALGHTEAPCIRLDHLTDEQRRAYTLAHNKTAEMSKWDFDMLDSELADIEIDMSGFGFADFDIEIDDEYFDESDLDEQSEKTNVIVSLNCGSYERYNIIKERVEELAEEIDALVAGRMA